jgi:hypothetical protein
LREEWRGDERGRMVERKVVGRLERRGKKKHDPEKSGRKRR